MLGSLRVQPSHWPAAVDTGHRPSLFAHSYYTRRPKAGRPQPPNSDKVRPAIDRTSPGVIDASGSPAVRAERPNCRLDRLRAVLPGEFRAQVGAMVEGVALVV